METSLCLTSHSPFIFTLSAPPALSLPPSQSVVAITSINTAVFIPLTPCWCLRSVQKPLHPSPIIQMSSLFHHSNRFSFYILQESQGGSEKQRRQIAHGKSGRRLPRLRPHTESRPTLGSSTHTHTSHLFNKCCKREQRCGLLLVNCRLHPIRSTKIEKDGA